jgi:Rps23 Pro-64 3,4-dihydroxylase Tpa1-like proline 4-hydroxylase
MILGAGARHKNIPNSSYTLRDTFAAMKKPVAHEAVADWIAPAYHDPRALAARYQNATPFPHIVLHNVLREEKADALRDAVRELIATKQFEHKESDLFSLAQSPNLLLTKNKTLAAFRDFLKSSEWTSYMKTLTGVLLTGTELDYGASLYTRKDFLLCHDDQVTGRKIAYVYYVGPDFTAEDGGALALLDTNNKHPGDVAKRYAPHYNSLALFTVDAVSWHEVEEVLTDTPRLSINGWLH